MRILHYLPYSYHIHTGWLEKIAQTIAEGLSQAHDIESLIIASDIRRWKGKKLSDYPDTLFLPSRDLVYNFPVPKFWSKSFWKSFKTIKNYKPDVIVTHTRFFVQSLIGGIIAKRLDIKRVHVEHGSWFVTGYPRYIKLCAWLFDWTIGLWIFRQCDEIVTISQMHRSFISQFTSKTPRVIYNPIDYVSQEKIKNTIPHIGFVGRLVPLKGVDVLIQALSQIKDHQWECTIVGTWDQDNNLKYLVDILWLSERIAFVWGDDRSHRLHKFDIFVNPSYQEWLPTTVVEALLAKCIVIATDVGGTREISDAEDLILVPAGDSQELLEQLLVAFERLDKSGLSYEGVKEKFGVENAIKKYIENLIL